VDAGKRIVEIRQHDLQTLQRQVAEDMSSGPQPEESADDQSYKMKKAADQEREKKKAVAEAMNNLGELCFASGDEGNVGDAKRYLLGSVQMMEEMHGPKGVLVMHPLLNYGRFLMETRDYGGALAALSRVLEHEELQHRNEMDTESLAIVPTLDLVGYCCVLMKNWDRALELCDRANAIVLFHCSFEKEKEKHMDMCERHDKRGFILFCSGDLVGAQAEYYKARDILAFSGREEFDEGILRLENNIAVCCCAKRPIF
jgi:hypothetical protein